MGSKTTSQLSLLSVVRDSDAVSHFSFHPSPLTPQDSHSRKPNSHSQTAGKIKGETAITKEEKRDISEAEGTRTMVSTTTAL